MHTAHSPPHTPHHPILTNVIILADLAVPAGGAAVAERERVAAHELLVLLALPCRCARGERAEGWWDL